MNRCIFCEIIAGNEPASVVYRDRAFVAFMDIFPCRPGHVLVSPTSHWQFVDEMPPSDRTSLFEISTQIARAIRSTHCQLACDDVHFVLNDGPAANQSVPHVHMHIIPRTRRDLGRLIAVLARRPIAPLLGPAPRQRLEKQAAEIRGALDRLATGD